MKAPAFQFYARDWLTDEAVRLMGPAGKGLYIDLLAHQWLEGSIPPDPDNISLLVGYPVADLWPKVKCRFQGRTNGRLFNRRLAEQRAEYDRRRKQKSEAGKISGQVRRQQAAETSAQRTPVHDVFEHPLNPASATATATTTPNVLSERAKPDVDNLYGRLGPVVRTLHPDRPEQNKWFHWAKHQKQDVDTLESWLGGLELLRDKGALEWVQPGTPVTCRVFMRFPELLLQCESAWARYGPGAAGTERTGMERLRA